MRGYSSVLMVAFVAAMASGAWAEPAPAVAATTDVQSVVGTKRKDADLRMKQQGYIKKNVTELEDGGSTYFWWNRTTKECLRVAANNGKIKNVKPVKEKNCD